MVLKVIFLQKILLNAKTTNKKQKQHGYDHNLKFSNYQNIKLLDFTQIFLIAYVIYLKVSSPNV